LRISRTLGSIVEGSHGRRDFGGDNYFSSGIFLQLPLVVKNVALPVSRRMITRLLCWPQIHKFILRRQHRCEDLQWGKFLADVATGSVEEIQLWSQVRERFHIHLTQSTDDALAFMCADLRPQDPFPLDRRWIGPTNQLVGETNQRPQE
jgi:hypothetical protein